MQSTCTRSMHPPWQNFHMPAAAETPIRTGTQRMEPAAFSPPSFPASAAFAGGMQPAGAAGFAAGSGAGFDPSHNFDFSGLDWDLVPPPPQLGAVYDDFSNAASRWVLNTVNRDEEDYGYGVNGGLANGHNGALANGASVVSVFDNGSAWFHGNSYGAHGGFANVHNGPYFQHIPQRVRVHRAQRQCTAGAQRRWPQPRHPEYCVDRSWPRHVCLLSVTTNTAGSQRKRKHRRR